MRSVRMVGAHRNGVTGFEQSGIMRMLCNTSCSFNAVGIPRYL
jgi:hypothetical protein